MGRDSSIVLEEDRERWAGLLLVLVAEYSALFLLAGINPRIIAVSDEKCLVRIERAPTGSS